MFNEALHRQGSQPPGGHRRVPIILDQDTNITSTHPTLGDFLPSSGSNTWNRFHPSDSRSLPRKPSTGKSLESR